MSTNIETTLKNSNDLLERSVTHMQFGDWHSLARLEESSIEDTCDRAELALLAAIGLFQLGDSTAGHRLLQLSCEWGCPQSLTINVLMAGAHSSLGLAAAISGHHERFKDHIVKAVELSPGKGDTKLLSDLRIMREQQKLNQHLLSLTETPEDLAELKLQLKSQREEIIRLRRMISEYRGNMMQKASVTGANYNIGAQRNLDWYVRAELAVNLIERVCVDYENEYMVADIGCGDQKLRKVLNAHGIKAVYHGYDIKPQNSEVIKFTIGTDALFINYDFVFLLGVIEYIQDPVRAISEIAQHGKYVIISHVIKDKAAYSHDRLMELGWVTHLSESELLSTIDAAGLSVTSNTFTPDGKTLLVICKTNHDEISLPVIA